MAKTSKKDASANIADVLAMMRHSFSTSDSVRHMLALVVLRWLADSRRSGYALPFALDLPPDLLYHIPLMQADDLPEWLDNMLHELELRNANELGGVFQHLNFKSPRFMFRQQDRGILGKAIDLLWMKDRHGCSWALLLASLEIARRALVANSGAPELNTPDSISTLVAALVRPDAGDWVYDPACGTGQMLAQVSQCVAKEERRQWCLSADERNPTAWMLAKLTVLAQGLSSRHIRRADVLRGDYFTKHDDVEGLYDVVVSHFPWSRKEWRHEDAPPDQHHRFRAGLPPKNNADYAYILHMAFALRPAAGRMAAVVSGGVLSRTGVEGRIRMRLLARNLVDGVIALPDKMFQSTSAAAAILLVRTDRSPRQDVIFIDARGMATAAKGANMLSPEAVQDIAGIYSKRAPVDGRAALASPDRIADNGCSLNVALYVVQAVEGESHDLDEARARRRELQEQLKHVNARIDELLGPHSHDPAAPGPGQA